MRKQNAGWKLRNNAVTLASVIGLAMLLFGFAPRAVADDDDPPSRVARLAYAQGSVSFQPGGTEDWVTAGLNRPVTTGDQLWSDRDGRVELQLDGSLIRLSNNTSFAFLNLSDNVTQIQLSTGTILVRVRRLDDDETYEIDTPNLAFSVLRPGLYRISVNDSGDSTAVRVTSGQGEVTGGGIAYTVHAREYATFSGTDQLYANSEDYSADEDPFDRWASDRDNRWQNSRSAQYVSPDVVGYEDLDDHGTWRPAGEYGNVWFPRTSAPDWAPYHYGHWDYIEPWGYTWVDDEPWGFAPFHYGRWVWYQGQWGWIPAPPQAQGVVYVRPVYAPALVAWVGRPQFAIGAGVGGGYAAGVSVGWFALGPREVYVPSYHVSQRYVENVNVSNTRVTTVEVNNYYTTTVVNNNVNVTNVRYANQRVRGAVAATTPQAFTSAQPVANNRVRVDENVVASAPVRAFTPAAVPAKQAVLGTGTASARPPAAVQQRAVVARVAPPPPPPSFERRQEAIKNNGGKPLSRAQVQQIAPATARREAPVRIAPAPKPGAQPASDNRRTEPNNTRPAAAPNTGSQAEQEAERQKARPVNPNNATPVPAPAANVEADRRQQQEQERLKAQQEQQQQKAQQDLERQKAQQDQQRLKAQQEQQQQKAQQDLERQKAQQDQQRLKARQEQQQQKTQQEQERLKEQERQKAQQEQQRAKPPAPAHPNEAPPPPKTAPPPSKSTPPPAKTEEEKKKQEEQDRARPKPEQYQLMGFHRQRPQPIQELAKEIAPQQDAKAPPPPPPPGA